MLVWLRLPFYDFCGFRSVAVKSVYKLQFFTFICGEAPTEAMSRVPSFKMKFSGVTILQGSKFPFFLLILNGPYNIAALLRCL